MFRVLLQNALKIKKQMPKNTLQNTYSIKLNTTKAETQLKIKVIEKVK
jgi:hypothetical protein